MLLSFNMFEFFWDQCSLLLKHEILQKLVTYVLSPWIPELQTRGLHMCQTWSHSILLSSLMCADGRLNIRFSFTRDSYKGFLLCHNSFSYVLLHVAELRRTRTQAKIIQNRILQVWTWFCFSFPLLAYHAQ